MDDIAPSAPFAGELSLLLLLAAPWGASQGSIKLEVAINSPITEIAARSLIAGVLLLVIADRRGVAMRNEVASWRACFQLAPWPTCSRTVRLARLRAHRPGFSADIIMADVASLGEGGQAGGMTAGRERRKLAGCGAAICGPKTAGKFSCIGNSEATIYVSAMFSLALV